MPTESALPLAQYRRFESTKEYEALCDELIATTQSVIRVFERALPAPWNATTRINLLRQFLRQSPANRLNVIVHDASSIERTLPRVIGNNASSRVCTGNSRKAFSEFAIWGRLELPVASGNQGSKTLRILWL